MYTECNCRSCAIMHESRRNLNTTYWTNLHLKISENICYHQTITSLTCWTDIEQLIEKRASMFHDLVHRKRSENSEEQGLGSWNKNSLLLFVTHLVNIPPPRRTVWLGLVINESNSQDQRFPHFYILVPPSESDNNLQLGEKKKYIKL